ncbi:MAG: hypothetical protein IJC62_04765, partial [Clostridia bacterium]|nr:hypothetical protein [Clostridia bacterium]
SMQKRFKPDLQFLYYSALLRRDIEYQIATTPARLGEFLTKLQGELDSKRGVSKEGRMKQGFELCSNPQRLSPLWCPIPKG